MIAIKLLEKVENESNKEGRGLPMLVFLGIGSLVWIKIEDFHDY